MHRNHRITAVALIALLTGAGAATLVKADILGSLVKGAAIGIAIKQFSRPINDAVNKLTGSAGAETDEATKVVPIVSIGQGSYVGAAQVSGPQEKVDQVQSVGMLEGTFHGREFQMKALVPLTTDKPGSKNNLDRVKGVGVSAIIDIKV